MRAVASCEEGKADAGLSRGRLKKMGRDGLAINSLREKRTRGADAASLAVTRLGGTRP